MLVSCGVAFRFTTDQTQGGAFHITLTGVYFEESLGPMKLLLKSLALFAGLAFASPALAFSYSCADWKDPDLKTDFWKEATPATIADCVQDMGFVMGFSVKDRDDRGTTPLHFAATYASNPEITVALLEAGADVNARDEVGWTPLHLAAGWNDNPDVITTLLQAGTDVNARDKYGETPLLYAAWLNDNPDVIIALVEAGADVNARNEIGTTPMHWAAERNSNPDTIIALVEVGADGSAKNSDGKTPFDLARDNEAIKNTDAYWALNDARYK
jgi:hypothetical protein